MASRHHYVAKPGLSYTAIFTVYHGTIFTWETFEIIFSPQIRILICMCQSQSTYSNREYNVPPLDLSNGGLYNGSSNVSKPCSRKRRPNVLAWSFLCHIIFLWAVSFLHFWGWKRGILISPTTHSLSQSQDTLFCIDSKLG